MHSLASARPLFVHCQRCVWSVLMLRGVTKLAREFKQLLLPWSELRIVYICTHILNSARSTLKTLHNECENTLDLRKGCERTISRVLVMKTVRYVFIEESAPFPCTRPRQRSVLHTLGENDTVSSLQSAMDVSHSLHRHVCRPAVHFFGPD